jgi:hypothetical protein
MRLAAMQAFFVSDAAPIRANHFRDPHLSTSSTHEELAAHLFVVTISLNPLFASICAAHRLAAGKARTSASAGLNHQDKSYSDITDVNSIRFFVIVNAPLGYEASEWGIDVNFHDITDRRYFVAANGAGAVVGEMRSASVGVHAEF